MPTAREKANAPAGTPAPLETQANPTGAANTNTGPVGDDKVIDAQEHVLGDDPRRVKAQTEAGFHDSLTGAPVDKDGNFTEANRQGQGPIPKHRIVADNWPQERQGEPARD
jgi:hypothetical protein